MAINHITKKSEDKSQENLESVINKLSKEEVRERLYAKQYQALARKVTIFKTSPSDKNHKEIFEQVESYYSQKTDTFSLQWIVREPTCYSLNNKRT